MRTPFCRAALLVAAFSWPQIHAQTVELRSGQVMIGRVIAIDADAIRLEVGYPDPATTAIRRDDVAPRSLYDLIAMRTPADDADARVALADTAQSLGLRGHAIAELEQAARVAPSRRAELNVRIAAIRAELARELLAEATDALADDRWPQAKLTAQVLVERYADTPSAAGARRVLQEALARGRTAQTAARKAVATADRALAAAAERERKADALRWSAPPGSSVKEAHQRERAVAHLEAAREALAGIDDPRATPIRARIEQRLGGEYLALATNFLARRALPTAEDWNARACGLDPESGGCHRLQDLIIQARITSGVGG